MPKRKHVSKKPVVACTDANQRVRESIKERSRKMAARAKKFQELREKYLAEAKRKEEEKKAAEESENSPLKLIPGYSGAKEDKPDEDNKKA